MTDSLEDNKARLEQIDIRLEELGDEFDLLRTVQNANRRETRGNSQTIARLERAIRELGDIARLHQRALQIAQQNAEVAQRNAEIDRAEIRRIWEYLIGQQRNGNGSGS